MPGSCSTQRETDTVNLTKTERKRGRDRKREGERDKDHPTAAKKNKAGRRAKPASITSR